MSSGILRCFDCRMTDEKRSARSTVFTYIHIMVIELLQFLQPAETRSALPITDLFLCITSSKVLQTNTFTLYVHAKGLTCYVTNKWDSFQSWYCVPQV